MIAPGDRVPDVRVATAPYESASLRGLVGGAPALLVFYLFDWSAT